MGFLHFGQAGLELPTLGEPPTSTSQSAGITGVSNHTGPPILIQASLSRLHCLGLSGDLAKAGGHLVEKFKQRKQQMEIPFVLLERFNHLHVVGM